MKKKKKTAFLLILLTCTLLACSSYKKVNNTKNLKNYEYTLIKKVTINGNEEDITTEKGYINDNVEKRVITRKDKTNTIYLETTKQGTFIYKEKENNEYERKRIPDTSSSYLNLIDRSWIKYENGNIVLDDKANIKILKMLHIHKYLADNIEMKTFDYTDNDKYITSLNVTFDLLKENEVIGTATIEYSIDDINSVKNITLPNLKERE